MKKVAIITGAASGIGLATAQKLLETGFLVCATDRDPSALNSFVETLNPSLSENFLPISMDVNQMESIEKAKNTIVSKWGQIDVLVNNAGIFETCSFTEMTEESFTRILNTNLLGVFRCTKLFSQEMIKRKEGKIINLSSIAASKGAPGASHYSASKGAVSAFSLSLAAELAKFNIQVNVVQPGFIETPMMNANQEQMKVIAAWRIPTRRLGQPWEIAEAIHYLATSRSSYFTGAHILIDGGFSLG